MRIITIPSCTIAPGVGVLHSVTSYNLAFQVKAIFDLAIIMHFFREQTLI